MNFPTDDGRRVEGVSSNPGVHRMAKTRRTFTAELKARAVKLVTDRGRSLAEIARDLTLVEGMLRAKEHARARGGHDSDGKGQPARRGGRGDSLHRQGVAISSPRRQHGAGVPEYPDVDVLASAILVAMDRHEILAGLEGHPGFGRDRHLLVIRDEAP